MSQPIFSVYISPGTAAAHWLLAGNRLVCNGCNLPDAQIHGGVQYAIDEANRYIPPFLILADSYVTFPVTPLLSVDRGDFSVSAWIRTAKSGTSIILDHRVEDSGTVQGWAFFTYSGRLNTQLAHPGVLPFGGTWNNFVWREEHLRQLPNVTDGAWHHVAMTIDRDAHNGGCWYIDGELIDWRFNPTIRPDSLSHQIPLALGKRSDSTGGNFSGCIGGVGFYHWALTAAEVAAIYAGQTHDRAVTEAIGLPPLSNPAPLPDCRTCQFCSTQQHHTDLGCAVNPLYWSQWKRRQSAARNLSGELSTWLTSSSITSIWLQPTGDSSSEVEAGLSSCHDYQPIEPSFEPSIEPGISEPIAPENSQDHTQNQAFALSTVEKLIGVWNYQVSFVPNRYRLQIFLDGDRSLIGRYLIPADNNSLFAIKVYESSGRGRPVLTIAQTDSQTDAQTNCCQSQPDFSYCAVLTGRLDRDGLITGSFVDFDNNQGTFTLEKQ